MGIGRPLGQKKPIELPAIDDIISSSMQKQLFNDPKTAEEYIRGIYDAPYSKGKMLLLKHLSGELLSHKQGKIAMCCECMGLYRDGREDCGVRRCPIYSTMPYRIKLK